MNSSGNVVKASVRAKTPREMVSAITTTEHYLRSMKK